MLVTTITLISLIIFGRNLSDVKLYCILSVLAAFVWLPLPVNPILFSLIVTAQTIICFVIVDAAMAKLPIRFSMFWALGEREVLFVMA